jgi:hypothetical protein
MLFGSVSGLANRVVTRSIGMMFVALTVVCSHLHAQQNPIPLPYTMTTLAGTSPMTGVAGTQCPNLPAGVTSTDSYGDGCLAVNGIFGAAGRGGVQVDSFGNVFVGDDVKAIIHAILSNSDCYPYGSEVSRGRVIPITMTPPAKSMTLNQTKTTSARAITKLQ